MVVLVGRAKTTVVKSLVMICGLGLVGKIKLAKECRAPYGGGWNESPVKAAVMNAVVHNLSFASLSILMGVGCCYHEELGARCSLKSLIGNGITPRSILVVSRVGLDFFFYRLILALY